MSRTFPNSRPLDRRAFLGRAAAGLCGPLSVCSGAAADDSHYRDLRRAKKHASELLMDGYCSGHALFLGDVHYDFQVYVDPTFTKEQKQLIRQAVRHHFRQTIDMAHLARKAAQEARWGQPAGIPNGQEPSERELLQVFDGPTWWHWRNALYGRVITYPVVDRDDPVEKRPAVDRDGQPVIIEGRPIYVGLVPTPRRAGGDPANKPSRLHISRIWDDPDTFGRGMFGIVKKKDPTYVFSIALNSDYMRDDDPAFWSGVIVHECLHDLGYDHPTEVNDKYDQHFINVFERLHASENAPDVKFDRACSRGGKRLPPLLRCCK